MKNSDETKNLNKKFSKPKTNYEITFKVDLGKDPKETMEKIKSVVKIIIENEDSDWDDEEYFHQILPQWVPEYIKPYNAEEYMRIKESTPKELWVDTWDFGSWLFMLGERAWIWQGYYIKENYAEIYLDTIEMAETGSTLEELIRAAGGKIIEWYHFLWSKKDD